MYEHLSEQLPGDVQRRTIVKVTGQWWHGRKNS
jgi:hypothetical protein